MNEAIKLLHEGNYSCVIINKGDIRTFTQRGVADLYDLIQREPEFLKGSSIADKVVGKAAAALMILGEVKELYTDMISQSALELFLGTTVNVTFRDKVTNIQNRDKSDWCPLEKITYEEKSIANIFSLIEDFMLKIRTSNNLK